MVVRWRFCQNNWRFGSLYFTYETFEPVPQIIIIATLVSKCFALQKESSSLNVRKVFRKPENYYRFTIYGLLYESRSLAQSSLARFRFLLCCCLPHSVENWLKKSHFTSFYIFKIVLCYLFIWFYFFYLLYIFYSYFLFFVGLVMTFLLLNCIFYTWYTFYCMSHM